MAAKTFNIPQATLRRHALQKNKIVKPNVKSLGRYKLTLTLEIERQLGNHLKLSETRLFGLAFQLPEKNEFPHIFNINKRRAGQESIEGFLRRNKDTSLRKSGFFMVSRFSDYSKYKNIQNIQC